MRLRLLLVAGLLSLPIPAEPADAGADGSTRGAPAPAVRRAIELEPGTISTHHLPRVEIGGETRTVLWRHPRRVLFVEHPVDVERDLPLALSIDAGDLPVYASGWVSIRSPGAKGPAGLFEGGRERLAMRPLWLETEAQAQAAKAALETPPDAEAKGRRGLLTALAWPLGKEASVEQESRPFEIATGDVLRFGFGVEDPAWASGFAPVSFVVTARDQDGTETALFERRIDPVEEPRDRRWFDALVPLDRVAGRSVRFVFSARALPSDDGRPAHSLPVFSNPEVVARTSVGPKHPNLILVSLDTLRAKSVGAYGGPRDTTPQLDRRVAAAGALMRTTVVPYPLTPPSHMTMLTGLEPCIHGVVDRDHILAPEHVTLAEMLHAVGYRTAAVTEDAYVVAGAGFARGFDTYAEERSDEQSAPGFGAATFAAAERWLDSRPAEPFFLFVHTYQVHAPYTPPRGYRALFPEVRVPDKPEVDSLLRDYEREIRYTDDLLAGFLDYLDATGLAEHTVLVITSDHGETFDEAIVREHGMNLKDSELLVPLLIRAPGIIAPGTVVDQQVGMVDLVPTLLDLLRVDSPAETQGKSFARLLGAGGPAFAERPLVSGSAGSFAESVRMPRWKYLRARKEGLDDRLYDLAADPAERQDYAADRPALMAEGRRLLEEHHQRCEEWGRRHPTSQGVDGLFEHRPGWLVNRDEISQKLRSLGYVE